MAKNEVAMNVDVPAPVRDAVEKASLRLRLAGDKEASKKKIVADLITRYLPEYEAERLKALKKQK